MSAPADKSNPSQLPVKDTTESWGWSRYQRIGLGTLLGMLLICLGIGYWQRPATTEPQVTEEPALLPQLLDPNQATMAELARVPHLGDTLASRIVAFREARKATTTDGIVFRQAGDLGNVPGIGPRLSEQFAPFFRFPPAETQPD